MEPKSPCNIYILTRVYNDYEGSSFFDVFEKRALASVAANKKVLIRRGCSVGRFCLMVFDDSESGVSYSAHKKQLLNLLGKYGFNLEEGTLDYTHFEHRNHSAYALFYLRKRFLELTEGVQDNAIAIILDQDDELHKYAAYNVLHKMPINGVVLSAFDTHESNDDIAKKIHNRLTRELCLCQRGNRSPKIVLAASMCWTKAYSRGAMKKYVDALESFLNKKRTGWESYFRAHCAYDDFIDFYVLLRADIKVTATCCRTHSYYKNVASITNNPKIEDFLYDRTANLITLIDLANLDSSSLINDWSSRLFRYVAIKTMLVEDILSRYRTDFEQGDVSKAVFSERTHNGYFINKFCRLAEGIRREPGQADDLFDKEQTSRGGESKSHFVSLFSCDQFNAIKEYKGKTGNVKFADSRYILQVAADTEKSILMGGKSDKKDEEELYAQYGINKTPNKSRYRALFIITLLFLCTLPIAVGLSFVPDGCYLFGGLIDAIANTIRQLNPNVKAAMVSLYGVILTYLLKACSDIKLLAKEEQSQMKLYFSEFEDLIRHLEANLKVMIQITKCLREDNLDYPADIHLTNLAWPTSSFLFSDSFAKIINKERVDDFARLKVNLRNINNSSVWLSNFVKTEQDPNRIIEAIDWEIARHFGYLVNFKYLKENKFHFAKQDDLDKFINANNVRNSLSALFMDFYSDEDEIKDSISTRLDLVEKYIKMYYDDRRMRRNVLVYSRDNHQ